MLPIRLQLVLLAISVTFTIYLLFLVKKQVLELKYTLTWLFMAFMMIVMAAAPEILFVATDILGIELPVNALFLFSLLLCLLLIFTLTVIVSQLRSTITRLSQEIGILKLEVSKLQDREHYHEHASVGIHLHPNV